MIWYLHKACVAVGKAMGNPEIHKDPKYQQPLEHIWKESVDETEMEMKECINMLPFIVKEQNSVQFISKYNPKTKTATRRHVYFMGSDWEEAVKDAFYDHHQDMEDEEVDIEIPPNPFTPYEKYLLEATCWEASFLHTLAYDVWRLGSLEAVIHDIRLNAFYSTKFIQTNFAK